MEILAGAMLFISLLIAIVGSALELHEELCRIRAAVERLEKERP